MKKALALALIFLIFVAAATRLDIYNRAFFPGASTGDLMDFDSSGNPFKISANSTATRKFLSETGTGSAGNHPSWVAGVFVNTLNFSSPNVVSSYDSTTGVLGTSQFVAGTGMTISNPSGTQIEFTASNAAAAQWRQEGFVADGVHNTYVLLSTPITNGILYVNEGGDTLTTSAWSLSTATVTITSTPVSGTQVDIGYFSNAAPAGTPFTDSFTYSGSSTFTLTYTPISGGIMAVRLNGQTLSTSGWTVGGANVTLAVPLITGDAIQVSYLH